MANGNTSDNKTIVRRLFEDGLNRDDANVIEALVAPEYVDGAGERGPGAFKQVMVRLRGAFPDLHYTIDHLLAEGDDVAIRWHWTGVHRGTFRGIAPTGQALSNSGAAVFRVQGGKIISAALETDRLGFLQAIGVVPLNEVLFKAPVSPVNAAPARGA